MIQGLKKELVKNIYNKTAGYYDLYHNLGTLGQDERGRRRLIDRTLGEGDYVLDAGGGTGTTSVLALKKSGASGKVVILDTSEGMLDQARKKLEKSGLIERAELKVGDMYQIPFPDETFDAVLSSYSTCPLENPMNAVVDMLRVLKKKGRLGIAHSTEPNSYIAKSISNLFERLIWHLPRISLGCRNISLIDDIRQLDVRIIEDKTIGIIPFFFKIIILEKN